MLVTLVRPPAVTTLFRLNTSVVPPIGVAYLAGSLRANGIDVAIVDATGEAMEQETPLSISQGLCIGLTAAQVVARVQKDTDIIGVSCMFSSSWPSDKRVIEALRAEFPNAFLVVGGEHATACPNYILDTCSAVDAVCRGEGEETLTDLVHNLRSGGDLGAVAGISWRGGTNIDRTRIRKVDDIPAPAWDLTPLENYLKAGCSHGVAREPTMPILATRGCPYACTFCSNPNMWTTRWTPRNPQKVVDEMAEAAERYNLRNFDLYDLTTIVKREWTLDFAQAIIDRGLDIKYQLASGTRSEAIDDHVAQKLVESGCTHITVAPESGSEDSLVRTNKKLDLEHFVASVKSCIKAGMTVSMNLIIFPDDTWKDVTQTLKFSMRCARAGVQDTTFFPYMPYPGTVLFEQLQREGRVPELSDEFFLSLLEQFDLFRAHSYNESFNDLYMRMIRIISVAVFHLTVWRYHPRLVGDNLRNIIFNTPINRAEKAGAELLLRLRSRPGSIHNG